MHTPERPLGLPGSTPASQGGLPRPVKRDTKTMPGLPGSERTLALPGAQRKPAGGTASPMSSTARKTLPSKGLPKAVSHEATGALPKPRNENTGALPMPARKTVTSGGLPVSTPASPVSFRQQTPAPREVTVATSTPAREETAVAPVQVARIEKETKTAVSEKPATSVATKRRRNRKFRLVKRDYQILKGLVRHKILTAKLVAKMVGSTPDSIRKRLTILVNEGYVERGPHRSLPVYFPTRMSAVAIGKPASAVGKPPTHTSYKHLLLIATIAIEVELGENVSELTGGLIPDFPQTTVTEQEIKASEANYTKEQLWANWKADCQAMLQDEEISSYPSLEYAMTTADINDYCEKQGYDEATKEEFIASVGRYAVEVNPWISDFWHGHPITVDHGGQVSFAHLANSRNPDLKTTRTYNNKTITHNTERTPDLVIASPNIMNEDGSLRGGCFAVEVELHPKKIEYCLTILLNLWHHPLYCGAIFVTDNPEVVAIMHKAMAMLASGPHSPFTMEQAEAYFHFIPPYLLNADLDATGLLA